MSTTLGEHITTQKGFAFKSKWYVTEGQPIVKVSDFTSDSIDPRNLICIPKELAREYSKYQLQQNDIIIQTVGSWPSNPASVVGKTIRVPRSTNGALLNQNAVKVIPNKTIDQTYLFYLLRNNDFKDYIVGTAQGAASQASITLDSIRSFKFDLPHLDKQRKIASILSTYDDLIENNNRRIAILEEMARRLYREWFVKFRFPGHEAIKMVDSELGKIPEGWEVVKLFDIAAPTYGFAFKSKLFTDDGNGIPVVRIRDIPKGLSNTFTQEHPKKEDQILQNGDLLIGMDGDFHMGKWSGGHAYLNQRVVKITPFDNYSKYFVFLSFQKPILDLNKSIVGTTVAHLGDKHLKEIKIILPEEGSRKQAERLLDALFDKEINLKLRNRNLQKQRNMLLPKLISGKINLLYGK
ncbi:restriction endonuclease subunit S [Sulfurimonas sp. HSL1-2]|uniref:restriction endonuclease subunit S n=1 Tax=Thiomicrolovo zhangzhouensis TaxID=3131933 RepID=UPI0031F8492E